MDHGTEEMYRKELRSKQNHGDLEPCESCKAAHAVAVGLFRSSKRPRDRSAETRAATIRRRALNALAEAHRAEFAVLLEQERRFLSV